MHENQLWVNEPLPYAYDALEPYIDEQTMHLHHDQHLQAYVNHLNEALAPFPKFQCLSLEQLICMAGRLPPKAGVPIARNAGGVYNHRFYFDSMTPEGPDQPSGTLAQAIDRRFGSFAAFQQAFAAAAEGVFGSGYGWLASDRRGQLRILTTANQATPLTAGLCPIMNVDMWEHAYYLKHYNKRADYLSDWWNVVNWPAAEARYAACLRCGPGR